MTGVQDRIFRNVFPVFAIVSSDSDKAVLEEKRLLLSHFQEERYRKHFRKPG